MHFKTNGHQELFNSLVKKPDKIMILNTPRQFMHFRHRQGYKQIYPARRDQISFTVRGSQRMEFWRKSIAETICNAL